VSDADLWVPQILPELANNGTKTILFEQPGASQAPLSAIWREYPASSADRVSQELQGAEPYGTMHLR
jgi:hypothetical protein